MISTLRDPAPLTIQVEEEFLLVDPDTGVNRPVAEQVVDALPEGVRRQSRLEFRRSVVGTVTDPCTDLGQLHAQLIRLRRAVAEAAEQNGTWLVAVGATPVREVVPGVPGQPRYQAMVQRYGPVALDP